MTVNKPCSKYAAVSLPIQLIKWLGHNAYQDTQCRMHHEIIHSSQAKMDQKMNHGIPAADFLEIS